MQTISLSEVITDIAAGPFGSNLKVSCFVESGFPIIDGANLKGFKVTDNVTKFVTEEKARSLHRAIAKRNDVVVTMNQSGTQATVIASGTTVGFIEFGTGVRYPEWDSTGMDYTPPKHGTYGKGKGASPHGWWFTATSGQGASQHTYGHPLLFRRDIRCQGQKRHHGTHRMYQVELSFRPLPVNSRYQYKARLP